LSYFWEFRGNFVGQPVDTTHFFIVVEHRTTKRAPRKRKKSLALFILFLFFHFFSFL